MIAGKGPTSSMLMAVGAFYLLTARQADFGRLFVRAGLIAGVIACLFQLFPSGDQQGKMVALKQPVTMAAMEGLFNNEAIPEKECERRAVG